MKPSTNLKNKTPSDTYWRVQLVCKKGQAHSSLEPPLEYNQDLPFDKSKFLEKFSANNFALSDAESNTYGLLNRGGIANLPLLRTL